MMCPNCEYCNERIDMDKEYPITKNYNVKYKRYCSYSCKNRAGTLRQGISDKKYMPKFLDDLDKNYIKKLLEKK